MRKKANAPVARGAAEEVLAIEERHDSASNRRERKVPAEPVAPKMVEAALAYAKRGWHVFPAPPGEKKSYKSAEFSGGVKWGATTDAKQIRQDFVRWPQANVCIVTGPKSGIFVVEADTLAGHSVDGIASLKALQQLHGQLPKTSMAESPSGSLHYYFNYPAAATITNSTSKIAAGVDVRGDGGMVVAVPSVKPGVGQYRWLNKNKIADAPDWLIELCQDKDDEERKPNEKLEADNLDELVAAVDVIPNDLPDYTSWKNFGMAIFAATGGSELGFELFDKFSRRWTCGEYDEAAARKAWQQITGAPPERIGVGTIYHRAEEAKPGWRAQFKKANDDDGLTKEQKTEINRLAALPLFQYDQQRTEVAERLGIRVGTLDQLVERARPVGNEKVGQGTRLNLAAIEPWPETVDGEKLITDLTTVIHSHIVLTEHQALAVTFWVLHAHALEYAEHSPRLHVSSPAPRCGKTTLLSTVAALVPKPVPTENITTSALFRIVEMEQPTLLIDEADIFLNDNEDMRGLLNAGHSRSGQVIRTVGDDFEPRAFKVWGPVVIAGLAGYQQR